MLGEVCPSQGFPGRDDTREGRGREEKGREEKGREGTGVAGGPPSPTETGQLLESALAISGPCWALPW